MFPENNQFFASESWRGYWRYRRFTQSVKNYLRYARTKSVDDLLQHVLESSKERVDTVLCGEVYWRARLGCTNAAIETDSPICATAQIEQPFLAEDMKPIPNWHVEGRANPRGIPYLYLANDRETALAEVRPWIGSQISLAQMEIVRDLKVINCCKNANCNVAYSMFNDKNLTQTDVIWMCIDEKFAKPVSRNDAGGDYIPTQIITEMFKREYFDGIIYKSHLSREGRNLALFNLDDARVVNCALYVNNNVEFDFRPKSP